jgi:hypothetical protein
MKAIVVLVFVVAALVAVSAVSGAAETRNLESPAQVTAFLPEQYINILQCDPSYVPLFGGPGNSDAELFRKWFNDESPSCGTDMHMNGLSPIAHLLQPEPHDLACLPPNYPCDYNEECCSLVCHPDRHVCLNVGKGKNKD